MFPSIITAICERASVDISNENDLYLKTTTALGARVFNKISLAKGEKTIRDNDATTPSTKAGRVEGSGGVHVGSSAEAKMMQDQNVIQNQLLLQLLEG